MFKNTLVVFAVVVMIFVACGPPLDNLEGISQAVCMPDQPPPCCPTCCDSPIVVDVAGDGLHLTDAVDGVAFALAPGHANQWSWTESGSDDAFLALDVDGDGSVTDGTELFGNHSIQVPGATPNGFLALAWYDMPANGGNGDGILDLSDGVWDSLILWTDANHDGWSDPGELKPVSTAVQSFNFAYKPSSEVDQNGNLYKYRSTLVPAPGTTTSSSVTDAWLHTTPATQGPASACQTETRCDVWTYVPVGNPLHMMCGNNPGGHGVPVYTIIDPVSGIQMQAELFGQPVVLVTNGPTSSNLQRELTETGRASLRRTLLDLSIAGCVVVYPAPDPFHTPNQSAGFNEYHGYCTSRLVCGGCGGLLP